jgi:hypothetical protein
MLTIMGLISRGQIPLGDKILPCSKSSKIQLLHIAKVRNKILLRIKSPRTKSSKIQSLQLNVSRNGENMLMTNYSSWTKSSLEKNTLKYSKKSS